MTTSRVEEINAEQAVLRAKLLLVKGTETEVYTRIVGYMRNIKNWNEGKKAELKLRVPFVFPTTLPRV
jgi:anaerobic ribonucleoside-triphosphate reductase